MIDDAAVPRYVRLVWGEDDPQARPGPKPSVDAAAIAAAGVRLADASGIGAVSMRAVAAEVGLTSMALYRYVESKRELVLMVLDHAFGPAPDIRAGRRGWRAQLHEWAVAMHDRLREHPWVVSVPVGEPPLLPNSVGWMERALAALAGTPISEQQKLSSMLLLDVYVRGQVALSAGLTRDADEVAANVHYARRLLHVADADRYPRVHAALRAGALDDEGEFDVDEFEFGLRTVLDGIAALVERGR